MRPSWAAAVAALTVAVAVGCGFSDEQGGGGARTLNWYVFNEPGGAYEEAIKACNEEAERPLQDPVPAPAHRRQPAARADRAPAGRRGRQVDLMGMDVIWTAEFAEAGWILPWEGARRGQATEGKLEGPRKTVEYEDKVWAHPLHHQHASCSGTARTRSTSRPRTSPGTR